MFCSRKLSLIVVLVALLNSVKADSDSDTLKCMVKYLQDRGVQEEFFSTVDTVIEQNVDCRFQMNGKVTKAYSKISDGIKTDDVLRPLEPCIMSAIKTDAIKTIIVRREAIKLNGLGLKVWNYFSRKEHLDNLKKDIDNAVSIAAGEKCLMGY